jgi:hypothetical protein
MKSGIARLTPEYRRGQLAAEEDGGSGSGLAPELISKRCLPSTLARELDPTNS